MAFQLASHFQDQCCVLPFFQSTSSWVYVTVDLRLVLSHDLSRVTSEEAWRKREVQTERRTVPQQRKPAMGISFTQMSPDGSKKTRRTFCPQYATRCCKLWCFLSSWDEASKNRSVERLHVLSWLLLPCVHHPKQQGIQISLCRHGRFVQRNLSVSVHAHVKTHGSEPVQGETHLHLNCVVISQTISWVSQVRLATVVRISVFIEWTVLPPVPRWFKFTAGVSHHTPPPLGGAGLSQLIIFWIFLY